MHLDITGVEVGHALGWKGQPDRERRKMRDSETIDALCHNGLRSSTQLPWLNLLHFLIKVTKHSTHKRGAALTAYLGNVVHDGDLKLPVHEGLLRIGDLIIQDILWVRRGDL